MARFLDRERTRAYASYIADCVRLAGEGIAGLSGGSYVTKRWSDLVDPTPEDDRTCEEITADLVSRMGLEVVET